MLAIAPLPLIAALALANAGEPAKSGSDWEALFVEDGVTVSVQAVEGRDLPRYRATGTMAENLYEVLAVFNDFPRHREWMRNMAESRVVWRPDDYNLIMYSRFNSPWPVWDRDVVLDTSYKRSEDGSKLELNFKNLAKSDKQLPEDVVRMPRLVGFYKMEEIAPGKTKVLYEVEADIGGSIPRWIAKRASKDLPYITLSKLRERVESRASRKKAS